MGKSEVGLYGVVGGMSVMLAYTMRLLRISPGTAGRAENRTLSRVWKCGGYECEANIYSKTYTEGSDPFDLDPFDLGNVPHAFES